MNLPRVVHVRYEPYDVYIGRKTRWNRLPQSKWANPYVIGPDGDRNDVLRKYRQHVVASHDDLIADLEELRGKTLGCWCKAPGREKPCHGDVLVELIHLIYGDGDLP